MEQNARLIWKFANFKLIYEYRLGELSKITLFPLPPPLNLLNLPVFFIKLIYHRSKNQIEKQKYIHQKNNQIYESIKGKIIEFFYSKKSFKIILFLEKVKSYSEKILKKS